jgi:N-acetyl-gamma-glutamyl-phosphate reductase
VLHNYVTTKKTFSGSPKTVALVGARGYSGLELARLLMNHPETHFSACYSHSQSHDKSFELSDVFASPNPLPPVLPLSELMQTEAKTVFLATPIEASLELAPLLLSRGIHVIDLSGAFRLEAQDYPAWYGLHPTQSQSQLLTQAHYGLSPFSSPVTAQPALIANPGCFATAALMALVPLLRRKLVQEDSIVIDAKSGTTGAGKKASESQLYAEVDGECRPYRVAKHQHLPEIKRYLGLLAQSEADLAFTTHLLPVRRGILCSIYGRLEANVSASQIHDAFTASYKEYPLASWGEIDGTDPQSSAKPWLLSLKRVVGSPRVQIAYSVSDRRIYLFSLIDNLLKGAASQAIENFNRLHDLPVSTGLQFMEGTL